MGKPEKLWLFLCMSYKQKRSARMGKDLKGEMEKLKKG